MKTKIMGVLNVTPDSFSDGGEYNTPEKAVKRAEQMLDEGADYIDIGGESTRGFSHFAYQNSQLIDEEEELARVLPAIRAIKQKLPHAKLSIDTWKAKVAEEALNAGVTAVNSLEGFLLDEKLAEVVAKKHCMIIIYHNKDKTESKQNTTTPSNICKEVERFFESQLATGVKYGIKRNQFLLDPGIGFGKSVEQNIEIIQKLTAFKRFDLPILIGVSRKSHLGLILKNKLQIETAPTERLEASLAETAVAVYNGATIVRTHDVLQTKKFLAVFEKFL